MKNAPPLIAYNLVGKGFGLGRLRSFPKELREYFEFLGSEVNRLLGLSLLSGVLWFLLDGFFLIILQGLLLTLGLVTHESILLPFHWHPLNIFGLAVALISFGVCRSFVWFLKLYLPPKAHFAFVRRERSRILELALLSQSGLSHSKWISTFSEVIEGAGQVLHNICSLIQAIPSLALLFVLGMAKAPSIFLPAILFFVSSVLLARAYGQHCNSKNTSWILDWEKANRTLVVGLRNHFLLKILGAIPGEVALGRKALMDCESKLVLNSFQIATLRTLPQLIGLILLSVILILNSTLYHLTNTTLITVLYIFLRFAENSSELIQSANNIRMKMENVKQLKAIRKIDFVTSDFMVTNLLFEGKKIEIDIDNIAFGFSKDKLLFQGISLHLEEGDTLLIEGRSGVGKSTLVSLLCGLLSPLSGSIRVNNRPIGEARSELAKSIGYAGTEPYLINGSIRENLIYPTQNNTSEDELWRVLRLVGLENNIRNTAFQLDTPVNSQNEFSMGQRQRISIARAILRNPKLLILDEATANLDQQSEATVIAGLKHTSKNRITVVVTHRIGFHGVATHRLNLSTLV